MLSTRFDEQERALEAEQTRADRLNVELADALAAVRQATADVERLSASEQSARDDAEAAAMRADAAEKELESERTTGAVLRARLDVQSAGGGNANDETSERTNESAQRNAEIERLQAEIERVHERFNERIAQEERRRASDVGSQRRENAELSERITKQQSEHEADRLRIKRQHEESAICMEEKYNKKIGSLELEISDLKLGNEHVRTENTRLEQELQVFNNKKLHFESIGALIFFAYEFFKLFKYSAAQNRPDLQIQSAE